MGDFLHAAVDWIVNLVATWGYAGIFTMMFVESSFVPFPSEVAMIPAGYLASQERMSAFIAVLCGIGGSVGGALFNYQLAMRLGLPLFEKVGKYFFVKPEAFEYAEAYFEDHGEITTFVGRLIPAVRQLISVPAGLARMHLGRFILYTSLGSGLWSGVLVTVGYMAGEHEDKWRPMLHEATGWVLALIGLMIVTYVMVHRHKKKATPGAE